MCVQSTLSCRLSTPGDRTRHRACRLGDRGSSSGDRSPAGAGQGEEGRRSVPLLSFGVKARRADGPSSPSSHAGLRPDQIAIMIGPELTVPGVPQVELPVSSKTTMLLYEMDIRYRVCLNGQEKLPGAQWANGDRVRDLAVADGKVSGIEQGPYHCLLVAGLGCLPPLFQH
jgi:hypothetical protein